MKLFPSKPCCGADQTAETTVTERRVHPHGGSVAYKRAKMIFHVKGEMRFWHWSDQEVVIPCANDETDPN